LDYAGRLGDSLRFEVHGGAVPVGYGDSTPPGFRYDLATDSALALPLVVQPDTLSAGSFPGDLDAYPYFAYVCPGAPVEPLSMFSVALTVAGALAANCRFEPALKWYELQRAPLTGDNAWTRCDRLPVPTDQGNPDHPRTEPGEVEIRAVSNRRGGDLPCCPTIAADDEQARQRAILLHYLETLLRWADALICRNNGEAFRRADVLLDVAGRILGSEPKTVLAGTAPSAEVPVPTLGDFLPNPARLNPRLMSIYQNLADRRMLIHRTLNGRRRRIGADLGYFGEDGRVDGWSTGGCGCGSVSECCCGCRPYRFKVLSDKAAELAAEVRLLGSSLLSAYEKGDAEYLAAVRAAQERQLLELTIDVRENELRDADWQVQALYKSKENAQARLRYYQNLIADGLIAGEIGYESLTGVSMASRAAGNISEAIAQGIGISPDFWIGVAGIAGTPLQFNQLPLGSKLAGGFATAARILNALAEIATSGAGLAATEANWDRREQEWRHQVDIITIEIQQIERQILGAERRRDQAGRGLDNAQRQVENSVAVQIFLRDKFTSHQLYLYLQRETAALYYQSYELARQVAGQAERAFNYELGHTARSFLPEQAWDSLHEGLLAGDRLGLAVRQMQQAYLDGNCREYELTKHISLRTSFPLQFLRLQAGGVAEIELPEWLFDLDYPGHYLRRVRNVSLTIPAVVGPYTGVHCKLTLLSSSTRVSPRLVEPPVRCCDDRCPTDRCGCSAGRDTGYPLAPEDARAVRSYAATEAIATSSGQNDSGLFELSFHDERYLPFEFAGAVSRWRIELPPETNFFDFDGLSDVVLHLNYTAREGGEALAVAAAEEARCRLPGDGLRLFDLRRDLPAAWSELRRTDPDCEPWSRRFDLALSASMFPFVPGRKVVSVRSLQLLVEAPCAEPGAVLVVRVFPEGHRHRPGSHGCDCERIDVVCTAGRDYPGLFRGELELRHGSLGPLHGNRPSCLATVEFPDDAGEICDVFLVAGYCTERSCGCEGDSECGCRTATIGR
ncbi:MAG TPA: hypothetical protein VFU36_17485, partial [Jatrophihabitans sp.]|nr:hypothetical protein [Jatrophihabitans sp.]